MLHKIPRSSSSSTTFLIPATGVASGIISG
jgi:hypothetical protein